MNKILKIIKILNDFYNVVSFKELCSVVEFTSFIRAKALGSAVRSIPTIPAGIPITVACEVILNVPNDADKAINILSRY